MLDLKHFHVVFTLPAELRPLAAVQPGRDPRATLVLHTWTRELGYHPHIHTIVTAGGLSLDGERFIHCHPTYIFPIAALAKVVRAKLLNELWRAYRSDSFAGFADFNDPEGFSYLTRRLPKDWIVYAKPSFDRGEHVLQYLGRYTHRVGISNSRLLDVTDDSITFRTNDGNTTTVGPVEFLSRFIRHVLPEIPIQCDASYDD
jgi:hypothetical protein